MKCLDATTEDRRISGDILYLLAFVAKALNKFLCTTSTEEFNALFIELFKKVVKAVFVKDGNQCCLDVLSFSHNKMCILILYLYTVVQSY